VARVAILGWGSLLWNPSNLRNERKWRSDGPWLPIEFARTSNVQERNGKPPYLSLVICPDVGLVRTYWDMSLLTEIEAALADLRSRERCLIDAIGCLPRGKSRWSSALPGLEGRIQEWLDSKKGHVDAVIWTNLGWMLSSATRFSTEDGMKWLRHLRGTGKAAAAEEYIRNAPPQIDTCLRRQARDEFGWSDFVEFNRPYHLSS
jgi:hypothetical protein